MTPHPPAPFDVARVGLSGRQLIEASAGTGKTWNICALYLRLLRERGLSVRELLVLTFTNAATAELRDRIRARLRDALAQEAEPAMAERLRLALHEFDQAAIHTIHGFCQRALGDAPFLSGSAFDTEQLQDDEELRLAVAQDFWRRRILPLAPDPALVAELQAAGDDPPRFARILRLHQAKPLATSLWPAALDGALDTRGESERVLTCWTELRALWPDQRDIVAAQLEQARPGLSRTRYGGDALEQALAAWDDLLAGDDPWAALGDFPKCRLLASTLLVPTKAALAAGHAAPGHRCFALIDNYLQARDADGRLRRLQRLALLRAMLREGLDDLRARKHRLHVQTFDDLLSGLHTALARPGGAALAADLRRRFPVALVDEFQDTDPLQLDILLRIYARAEDGLFLVGDPKQAIYSFRNADLESYLRARDTATMVWTLGANQRASAELISALNVLFGRSPEPFWRPGLHYPPASLGARPRLALSGDAAARAALNVWLLPRDGAGLPLRLAAARQWAADTCAAEIVRLITLGRRHRLRLGERALDAGDIAVLVRTHADGLRMRAALEARGVACVELSQASIFASADAAEVLTVLTALAEPDAVGRVLAALSTMMLGGDASLIEEIRHDERRLAAVLRSFAEAAALWQLRGFGVMFRQFLERQGVYPRLLARGDGSRRVTNLRHLVELLHVAERRHAGPAALLRWLRGQLAGPGADDEQQLRLDSDAHLVQIVTVHRAKGLEYPVVFCPLLWTPAKAPGGTEGARLYHADDGGVCIDYRSADDFPSREPSEEIDVRIAREAHAEQLRLIYVAVTRAAQRCYLVAGAFNKARGSGPANCDQAGRTPLNALVDPRDASVLSPGEWKAGRHTAEQIDARWHDLRLPGLAPEVLQVATPAVPLDARLAPQSRDPADFHARTPPLRIPARRRIGSYSALLAGLAPAVHPASDGLVPVGSAARVPAQPAGRLPAVRVGRVPPVPVLPAGGEDAGRDHDALAVDLERRTSRPGELESEARGYSDPVLAVGTDILAFPRGADAGTCLHAILERVDFARPAGWTVAIEAGLSAGPSWPVLEAARRGSLPLRPMLAGLLDDLASTSLPAGFRLADLDARRSVHEFEFHLPVGRLLPERLQAWLAARRHAMPALRFEPLQGHLRGYIDLVCEHQGRWYLIDWKSNHLGDRPEDYAPPALQAEVDRHGYALQALIYLLALHRFLACRLVDYAPARHLGGALYLFVRGVRPAWRTPDGLACGVWFHPGSAEELDEFAQVLAGEGVA